MLDLFRAILEPPLIYLIAGGLVTLLVLMLALARYFNRRYVILPPLEKPAGEPHVGLSLFGR